MSLPSNKEDQEKRTWVEIYDPEMRDEQLAAQIAERVQRRQVVSGQVQLHLPTYGFVSDMPEPGLSPAYPPNLYHNLKQVNRIKPPETTAVLISSPATRLPILGFLWRLIRREAHNLILFYVNRAVSHNVRVNNHMVSILNELTRLTEAQQSEIKHLRAELAALKQPSNEKS